MGGLWIKSGYQRTGAGRSAVRADDGSARWVPLRVREELEREQSPELTARYEQLNSEFDRRAGIAWA